MKQYLQFTFLFSRFPASFLFPSDQISYVCFEASHCNAVLGRDKIPSQFRSYLSSSIFNKFNIEIFDMLNKIYRKFEI